MDDVCSNGLSFKLLRPAFGLSQATAQPLSQAFAERAVLHEPWDVLLAHHVDIFCRSAAIEEGKLFRMKSVRNRSQPCGHLPQRHLTLYNI